jgi:RNA polymerase sigma factor (sigma-70 family)
MTPDRTPLDAPQIAPGELLAQNYLLVRDMVRSTGRQFRLSDTERQDFESWVWVRLVDRDYRVMRRFQRRSSLHTYLRVVLRRNLLDYRTAKWGKWRPSARARRLGAAAVATERMIVRDRIPIREAATRLGVPEAEVAAFRPRRLPRIEEPLDDAANLAARPESSPDAPLHAHDRQALAASVGAKLATALQSLTRAERELLWLRHGAGLTVATIGRRLNQPDKSLYRKYERLYATLRVTLESLGLTASQVSAVAGAPDAWIPSVLQSRPVASTARPSEHPRSYRRATRVEPAVARDDYAIVPAEMEVA